MKNISCILLLLFPIGLFAQNTWDGSSVSSYTTGGVVSIGATPLSSAKLRINNQGVYGFYNITSGTSTSNQYGIYNHLSGTSTTGIKYGIYNKVAGSSLTKYGIYTEVENASGGSGYSSPTAYGIYAKATGQNARAAYFSGDVENSNSNTIFSSSNGSKTMFYSTYWQAGLRSFSIVMNGTDNQYDFNFEKGLEFQRSGLLTKYIDSDNMAFAVKRQNIGDVFRIYGDGKVYATEINVKLASQFPDYVFSSGYKLMPISDLRTYIQTNSKLPNMPSAQEVVENGLNIGETNRILVEKIEELTLYLLDQQEIIESQAARLQALEEKLK